MILNELFGKIDFTYKWVECKVIHVQIDLSKSRTINFSEKKYDVESKVINPSFKL